MPVPAVSTTCPLFASESAVWDAWRHIAQTFRCWTHFFNFHMGIWHLEQQPTSAWNTASKDCLNMGLVWAFSGEMFFLTSLSRAVIDPGPRLQPSSAALQSACTFHCIALLDIFLKDSQL